MRKRKNGRAMNERVCVKQTMHVIKHSIAVESAMRWKMLKLWILFEFLVKLWIYHKRCETKERTAWTATIYQYYGYLLSTESFQLKHHYTPDGIKVKMNSNGCVSDHKRRNIAFLWIAHTPPSVLSLSSEKEKRNARLQTAFVTKSFLFIGILATIFYSCMYVVWVCLSNICLLWSRLRVFFIHYIT